jgi:hypothetical protein
MVSRALSVAASCTPTLRPLLHVPGLNVLLSLWVLPQERLRKLWVMGYHVFMGYGSKIPAYQVGGPKKPWGIRGYGLYPLWVKRGSTVFHNKFRVIMLQLNVSMPQMYVR